MTFIDYLPAKVTHIGLGERCAQSRERQAEEIKRQHPRPFRRWSLHVYRGKEAQRHWGSQTAPFRRGMTAGHIDHAFISIGVDRPSGRQQGSHAGPRPNQKRVSRPGECFHSYRDREDAWISGRAHAYWRKGGQQVKWTREMHSYPKGKRCPAEGGRELMQGPDQYKRGRTEG